MQTQYIKVDENTLKVIKAVEVPESEEVTYDYDFLKEQELNILKQMNDYVAARQKELDEVRTLIAEAEKMELKTKEEIQAEAVVAEETKLEDII